MSIVTSRDIQNSLSGQCAQLNLMYERMVMTVVNPLKTRVGLPHAGLKLSYASYTDFIKTVFLSGYLKPNEIILSAVICRTWKEHSTSNDVNRALYFWMMPPLYRNLSPFPASACDWRIMIKLHYITETAHNHADATEVALAKQGEILDRMGDVAGFAFWGLVLKGIFGG